jgi:tetratricopeptide (TPR) repeat protein
MRTALVCTALILVATVGGCDTNSARRKTQEANELYKEAKYEEARKLYEEALALAPDLEIIDHNLGITLYKLAKRGDDSPENQDIANQAAEHLGKYLKKHPKDNAIRDLMTGIWVDTGQTDKAIAFWKAEHDANPKNKDVLEKLAGLNFKNGDWREAVRWYGVEVDVAETPSDRASAYLLIGRLCFSKLFNGKDTTQGAERIEIADIGIAALQKAAEALEVKKTLEAIRSAGTDPGRKAIDFDVRGAEIMSIIGGLNQQRAIAQGASWAFYIDNATWQDQLRAVSVLNTEAQKLAAEKSAQEAAQEAAAPGGQGT